MNGKFGFAVVLLAANTSFSQIVVTIPQYPTENDSIVITFDATQTGAAELINYSGTIYTHTGVITNLSTGPSDWKYVKGSWGNNSTQPVLTRLGANLYQLVIGRPRDFYNLADPTERIIELAFVFRSSDATKQTRPDIFVDLFKPGISLIIDQPPVSSQFGDPLRTPVFAGQSDTITVKLLAAELGTKVSTLTLSVNGLEVEQSDSNKLYYDFRAADHSVGVNMLRAIGIDTAGSADTAEFAILVNPSVQDAPLPEGLDHGINYVNSTTVTLALFAPSKKFVYVIGDFNEWKVGTEYHMKRHQVDTTNVVWWMTINGLTPGQEYAFQYLVDGDLRIGDPYTEKVLDPWNDQYIPVTTYPNRKPYPTGKTAEPVSVLQTDQIPYDWQITNFQRPAKTDLVIYELLVRDFLSTHSYATLTDTLNYFKVLGVNAIELMPVMEFEGNESWGYNPSFPLALDKYYGSATEFERFVDSAHAKGIAVILDIALNHAFGQSPLVRLYWDAANNRPAANNPWFNPVARHPFNVGYDFNHESAATKRHVDRVTKHWVTKHKVDGFRFDLSKGFTQTNSGSDVNSWGQYDQSRIDLLKRMADSIWVVDSTIYIILEHFAANSEETVLASYGMMLWGNMNNNYNEATMGYNDNNKSDLSWGSYKTRGWAYPHLITYMESHDEERLMYKNLQYGNSTWSYTVKDLSTALNRIKLAASFFFTIPGPKMIWQFGELGYDVSIDEGGRLSNKPIKWDYFDDSVRRTLFKVFAALTRLKQYDAFTSGNFLVNVGGPAKRIGISDSSMDVTIIGNFDVIPLTVNPDFSRTGLWYDYFSGDSVDVSNTQALFSLQPGEFRIYTTIKLPVPDLGQDEMGTPPPSEFVLHQNYPNPFNPGTSFDYDLPSDADVSLRVYNLLGQEVTTLVDQRVPGGRYTISWNGRSSTGVAQSTGVYIVRFQAEHFTDVRKILLLR